MIACLGWGSLVWQPRQLPIVGHWDANGPKMSVEFVRQSRDGRITLAIDPASSPTRVLWVQMLPTDVGTARLALKKREEITAERWERLIPVWKSGEENPTAIPGLDRWAESVGATTVIWTGLGPKFRGVDRRPSIAEVLAHLDGLHGAARDRAERYVRNAPTQIDTEYRREIQKHLGWSPSSQ